MRELSRVLEEESMDDPAEAEAYDAMEHGAVNAAFVADLLGKTPDLARTLDVGTGTARIPIALWTQAKSARLLAIDLSEAMLAVGRRNVEGAGASAAIELARGDSKGIDAADGAFTCVISNSIIHHIPSPGPALAEMARVLAPGGLLFVRDLKRPETMEALEDLVAVHAANDTPSQRKLFADSLHAALTADEVRALVAPFGARADTVAETSDRHFTLAWRKP